MFLLDEKHRSIVRVKVVDVLVFSISFFFEALFGRDVWLPLFEPLVAASRVAVGVEQILRGGVVVVLEDNSRVRVRLELTFFQLVCYHDLL